MGPELVGLILLGLATSQASEYWVLPDKVRQAASQTMGLPVGERISAISYEMRGKKYITDPIGEGVFPDTDPMFRYDAYDCLTFVEEVLGLAMATEPSSSGLIRNQLRYAGSSVTYKGRNHFMVPQWLPNSIDSGLLVDITDTLGPTKTITKNWTPRIWRKWRRRHKFSLESNEFPLGRHSITVLPLDTALSVVRKIPEGAIVLVVRTNNRHNPIMITHLGFLVYKRNKPLLRHATKMGEGMVRDESIYWYLNHLKTFKWRVAGVAIFMPREQGPVKRISGVPEN